MKQWLVPHLKQEMCMQTLMVHFGCQIDRTKEYLENRESRTVAVSVQVFKSGVSLSRVIGETSSQ